MRCIWKYEWQRHHIVSLSSVISPQTNMFRYYLGTMLTQAGVSNTTTQLEINIYLSVWCLFTAILGTSLADKIGRKNLGASTLSVSLIFLFLVGALTKRTHHHQQSIIFRPVNNP